MSDSIRFESSLFVRCPIETSRAVAVAAVRKQQKPTEWVRNAIRAALQADGINPASELAGADLSNQRGA
jgi:hypothetical protein